MIEVVLFTKEGCGLCDEVKMTLQGLAAQYPHTLKEVDITQDDALFARYRFSIPVVKMGNITLKAPITAVQLKNSLAQCD